jgi:hypothetical protein
MIGVCLLALKGPDGVIFHRAGGATLASPALQALGARTPNLSRESRRDEALKGALILPQKLRGGLTGIGSGRTSRNRPPAGP